MTAPADTKPPTVLQLIWEHDLVLGGRSGEVELTLDSASKEGPSPMQALAFGLAGCMAMDVIFVLKKGRQDLRGLRVDLTGERMSEDPRRFRRMSLHYTITGTIPSATVERAIQLSREKYCSVWHSMRQDIDLDVNFTISEGV